MSSLNLPPLPPVGGETTRRTVVDVIEGQDRKLVSLGDRLADAAQDRAFTRP